MSARRLSEKEIKERREQEFRRVRDMSVFQVYGATSQRLIDLVKDQHINPTGWSHGTTVHPIRDKSDEEIPGAFSYYVSRPTEANLDCIRVVDGEKPQIWTYEHESTVESLLSACDLSYDLAHVRMSAKTALAPKAKPKDLTDKIEKEVRCKKVA